MCFWLSFHIHSAPPPTFTGLPADRRVVSFHLDLPHDLIEDTTCAPHVHLEAVVAVGQEALRRSVPAGGDVLCVRRLGVHTPARAKVAELQAVVLRRESIIEN